MAESHPFSEAEMHLILEQLEKKIAEATLEVSVKGESYFNVSKVLLNLSNRFVICNRFEESVGTYRKAVDLHPDRHDVHFDLANFLLNKIPSEAAESYLAALKLCPTHSPSLQHLAFLRFWQKNFDEAEQLCRKAIEVSSTQPPIQYRLSEKFVAENQLIPKIFETSTEDVAVAHAILGKIANGRGDVKAAKQHFDETRRWGDNCVTQVDNILVMMDNFCQEELSKLPVQNEQVCNEIKQLKDHLRRNPTSTFAIGQLNIRQQACCDWKDFGDRMRNLSDLIDYRLSKNLSSPVDMASAAIMFPLSLQQQLAIATHFTQWSIKESTKPSIQHRVNMGKRLRIGYVLTGLIGFPLVGDRSKINRDRFEVFYYCLFDSPTVRQMTLGDDLSDWNDHVIDLSTFGDNSRAAANRIASDGIQILINLDDSHSSRPPEPIDNASAILSHRPAPIQAVYRADLGSTGASYVDYFITDKVASPLKFSFGYSEKLAYMPNGMFVWDEPELMPKSKPQDNLQEKHRLRRRVDLPESAIVFGVNSRSFHMDPETFGSWCEILRRVTGSVLWFSIPHMEETKSNLRKEAKQHKINPNRLIFVDASMLEEATNLVHTHQLYDVVLDTPMCNGGTGLMYLMCLGVPVVTMPRESFTSRLTASMLTSIGRKELIAKSKSEYVEMAVKLGNNAELLREMKAKLRENLPDANLVRQYFVDLEILYAMMWKLREMGEKPEHIV